MGPDVVGTYDKARRKDVLSRTFAVDMLNRSLLAGWFPPFQLARGAGLHLLKAFGPLRRMVMRQGMTPDADLPRLMRASGEAPTAHSSQTSSQQTRNA